MSSSRLSRLAALLAVLALAGCLKEEEQVKLNKDGSGTFVQTATIDRGLLEQLKGVGKMVLPGFLAGGPAKDGGGDAGGDIDLKIEDMFSPDAVKARLKGVEGVEVKKAESADKDGKTTARFEIAFASLESVARTGLFLENSVELKKNEDGSYTLTFDFGIKIPGLEGPAPAPDPGMEGAKPPGGLPGGMGISSLFTLIQPIVSGLETKRTIVVPGTVTDTNGEKKEVEGGTAVTWTQAYKDFASGKPLTQKVTFQGEGLELKPFTYKQNFAELMKRYLKITGGDEGEGEGEGEGKDGKEGKEKPPTPVTPNK